jgi:hypothetical protein
VGPIDALWHLLNFFAPAFGVGLLTALTAKLLWRRSLKSASLKRLSVWAVTGSALALLTGLIVFGSDGKMLTYGAMVLACALSVWWAGFGPRRR